MRTVLLERRLGRPLQPGATPNPESAICCTPALIRWRGSYVSSDRRHAYLLATAPDLESVRLTVRRCGADVHWRYAVEDHLLMPQVLPNMAFEMLASTTPTIEDVQATLRSCAGDTEAVRVLREIGGPALLVLARTPCRTLQPAVGLTIKSGQPLLYD